MTENKKDWRIIEYFVPIKESVSTNGEFVIKGVAINEGVTRNGVMYEAVELERAAPSLKGKPLLKDHENKVENIVGKVKNAVFNRLDSNINFEAKIIDKKMQEMISDGRIENVSIGATVQDLIMNEGDDFVTAKGLDFVELSLVAVPGDAGASFAKACMESFKLKEASKPVQLIEVEKMKMKCEKCGKEAMATMGSKCEACGGPMKKIDMEEEKMSEDVEKMKKDLFEAQEKLRVIEAEKAKVEEKKKFDEAVAAKVAEEKAKMEEAVKAAESKKDETKGKVGQKATESEKKNVLVEKANNGFSYSEESFNPKLSRFQRN